MNGKGKFIWHDKKVYKGSFKANKLDGEGRIEFPNGQIAAGRWKDGENLEIDDIKN